MTIQLSALICTRDRADVLRLALASLTTQTIDPALFEVIVVDNGSSDHTRQVVESFSGRVAGLRYLYAPVPGLSRARNAAWQAAQGRYVAFLDDDAEARPDWAAGYLATFTSWHPTPGSIGGKAEPIFDAPRPDWLSDRLLPQLSIVDLGDEPFFLAADQWVAGCNLAFTVEALRAAGGFREALGRVGDRLISGEETYLRQELDRLGFRTLYHPGMVVGHHLAPARLSKRWFRRHATGTGQTEAILLGVAGPLPPGRRLLLALRKLAWMLARAPLALLPGDAGARFRRELQLYEAWGFLTAIGRVSGSADR
ncbi:MAG: glycosyltransferase [Anaerolineae bacterium]|nr:glycosyltransferase [Anaerolineae bacterium]